MDNFGETIRKHRESNKLPLRKVAAFLDIDQAVLSKIERGQRNANRDQVKKFAKFFKISEDDLLVSWLSDKLVKEVSDENIALKALQVAEEKIQYSSKPKIDDSTVLGSIRSILRKDGRVSAAWIFGSFARGEENLDSDIDLMVEMNQHKNYSMFDLLDIAHTIEQKVSRKVDLVEKGFLKDFALKDATKELIKIYE